MMMTMMGEGAKEERGPNNTNPKPSVPRPKHNGRGEGGAGSRCSSEPALKVQRSAPSSQMGRAALDYPKLGKDNAAPASEATTPSNDHSPTA